MVSDLKHITLLEKAQKEIELADHLLYITYPMVRETKFLLAILEHIINAARLALSSILEFEKYWKRLEPFPDNFKYQIFLFKERIIPRYNIDLKYFRLLNKLYEIDRFNKTSIVRFKKGEKYILTNHEYNTIVIDLENVKRLNNISKKFVNEIKQVVNGPARRS